MVDRSKPYYDETDPITEYWDTRFADWLEKPDWGAYPYKQAWFRERFGHLLVSRLGTPYSTFDPEATHVLDYGCGCALYADPLLDYYDYYQGFDPSISAIATANRYYQAPEYDESRFYRMNLAVYTGKPGCWTMLPDFLGYDLVISITVLQHQPVPYRLAMIENIKSLLKPGGMYIGLEFSDRSSQAFDMPPIEESDWRKAWLPLVIERDIPVEHPTWRDDNVWTATNR